MLTAAQAMNEKDVGPVVFVVDDPIATQETTMRQTMIDKEQAFDLYFPGNSGNGSEAADRKRGIVGTVELGAGRRLVWIPCDHYAWAYMIRAGRNTCSNCERQYIAVPREDGDQQAKAL